MEHSKDLIKNSLDAKLPLAQCPVKIPKSGAKLFKYKGVTLFFRTIKGLVQVYEAEFGFLICVSIHSKDKTLEIIVRRWKEIENAIDERRTTEVQ